MRKKSTLGLMLLLSALLTFVAACGTNSTTTLAPQATAPTGENIYVLDGYTPLGSTGIGQHIVAFHPGSANPAALISLPAGLTSLDHQRLYTATAQNGRTTISVVNTLNGKIIRSFVIAGTYSTAGQGYDASVLSLSGQWLALRDTSQTVDTTTIALVDTQAGKLVKTIHLNGNFTLDAISPGGKGIYLLEKLNDAPGHYYVRAYLVDQNALLDTPLVDKTNLNVNGDPNMTGSALTRQMLNDGTYAYTLYIDPLRNIAFVHILPLSDQVSTPFAHCVDLPVGKDVNLLRYYTLALSSDGRTLYAANGALGVVSSIDVHNTGPDIFDDKIQNTVHFNPGNASISSSDKTRSLYNGAVLSPDQKTMYFAGMHGIWAVNTSDLSVQGHYLAQQTLTGVALSADGQTLYAVDPTNGITLLNAATGQAQQVIQQPARTPWGIEWITN